MRKNDSLVYGFGGLLLGLLIAWGITTVSVNNDYRGMMQMMGINVSRIQDESAGHMGMSMNGMQMELQGETGDDFDKIFIEMMIAHHQGAIAMAEQAKKSARHDEIKKMADAIIATQSSEITKMKGWQIDWGYTGSTHMIH